MMGQHGVLLWVAQMRGLGGSREIHVFCFVFVFLFFCFLFVLFLNICIDVLGSGDVCKVSRYM